MQRSFKQMLTVTGLAGVMGLVGTVGITGTPQGTTMVAIPSEGLQPGDSFEVMNDPDTEGSECRDGVVIGDTGGIRPGAWEATTDANGDWSVTIAIPENGPPTASGDPTPFPAGDYEIHARCSVILPARAAGVVAPAQQSGFDYDPITVTVVAAQETTTTTSTPTTAPPTPTTAPPTGAAPTVAVPTYTG